MICGVLCSMVLNDTSTMIVNNMWVPKSEKNWNELDKKLAQLNIKIINILYCALDYNEFNRISIYLSIN